MLPLRPDDPHEVGPYTLRHRLGEGGMGVVYLGEAADGGQAAVKVVRAEVAAQEEFRRRFGQEIEVLKRLHAASVATVLAYDAEAPRPWLATGYVDGVDLGTLVERDGALSEAAALRLAHGLAEALRALHQAGVIHRDIKPSNVMMTADGPVLIDFGIARYDAMTRLTSVDAAIGSQAWMAPEQVTGRSSLTPAVDVFSAALTVAYAALGRHPHGDGTGEALLWRNVHQDVDLSSSPVSLRPWLAAALVREPGYRATAATMASMLQAGTLPTPVTTVAAPVPTEAYFAPAVGAEPQRPTSSTRILVPALVGAVLLVVVLPAVSLWSVMSTVRAAATSPTSPGLTFPTPPPPADSPSPVSTPASPTTYPPVTPFPTLRPTLQLGPMNGMTWTANGYNRDGVMIPDAFVISDGEQSVDQRSRLVLRFTVHNRSTSVLRFGPSVELTDSFSSVSPDACYVFLPGDRGRVSASSSDTLAAGVTVAAVTNDTSGCGDEVPASMSPSPYHFTPLLDATGAGQEIENDALVLSSPRFNGAGASLSLTFTVRNRSTERKYLDPSADVRFDTESQPPADWPHSMHDWNAREDFSVTGPCRDIGPGETATVTLTGLTMASPYVPTRHTAAALAGRDLRIEVSNSAVGSCIEVQETTAP